MDLIFSIITEIYSFSTREKQTKREEKKKKNTTQNVKDCDIKDDDENFHPNKFIPAPIILRFDTFGCHKFLKRRPNDILALLGPPLGPL